MSETKIKKIPYGISDYGKIVKDNAYYVDKTPYFKAIEEAGDYLFFIRPRRFGKSLFLTTMEAYFGILYKERYDTLFKGTWIYDHPTDLKHRYLVLKFNFSAVDIKYLEESFTNNVRDKVYAFLHMHSQFLDTGESERVKANLQTMKSASDILSGAVNLCRLSGREIFIIIDEYDNFANTILSTSGRGAYEKLTRGEGFFRTFFNFLKEGTTAMDAPISRLFITGVSPVTLDDVTSGFNIGDNISLDARFNHALGFTSNDVRQMLNYYKSAGLIAHETDDLLEIMDEWYGRYLFSEYAINSERLFNSDMVLYFLKEYFKNRVVPKDLVDSNVRIDYGKLRHLIIVDKDNNKTTNGNFSQLKEIIEKGGTSANIIKSFPLEKLTAPSHFKSLLFYFGLLTIDAVERDKLRLIIPNETANRLYYDYISEAYRETGVFDVNLSKYSDLMSDMAYDGEWRPLFEFITGRMKESLSLRDLITGEKSIQAFLNVYLGLSQLYIIHTEKELNHGFADITMEPFLARYNDMKYAYLLELKYLKQTDSDADLKAAVKQAEKQLKQYALDDKFKKTLGQTTLVKLALVFSGTELKHIGSVA